MDAPSPRFGPPECPVCDFVPPRIPMIPADQQNVLQATSCASIAFWIHLVSIYIILIPPYPKNLRIFPVFFAFPCIDAP
jgi:hypothetical protein